MRKKKGVFMKRKLLSALATMLTGTGAVLGQANAPPQSSAIPVQPPAQTEILNQPPSKLKPIPQAPASATPGAIVGPNASPPSLFPGTGVPLFADPATYGDDTPVDGIAGDPTHEKHPGLFGCAWASFDYLLWWTKSAPNPVPLVTTNPGAGSAFLGAPGTSVAFGGSEFDFGATSGARMTFGVCEPTQTVGLEVTALYLAASPSRFSGVSTPSGSPLFGRPYQDAVSGLQDALLVSFPGAFAGGINVSASSTLWGIEMNLLRHSITSNWEGDGPLAGCQWHTDWLMGMRYLSLREDLLIEQQTQILANGVGVYQGLPIAAPNSIAVTDRFDAANQFFGGQVGMQNELTKGKCYIGLLTKVALGSTYEVTNVNGKTSLVTPAAGVVGSTPGGLLALPTNIGLQSRSRFTYVPEVDLNFGYEVTTHLRVYLGYSFLYWSSVIRPGDQLSTTVNKSQLPTSTSFGPLFGPAQPAPKFVETDFWAHGLNCGFAVRY